ncbi:MAG: Asp-tRNA(Asn)/Glu-tRNA(Gln) amidotransferase subunit GatC [Bacteroidetes bacterium]|nr:Asp-tRNA(Asn)/Glu-tRNA(Gln) amidotransferase subunit GatC [Bacteroidota bacterium]MBS1757053.1 Asp-tRNA(Asn)/Glu-tRNA(Gln) amidotransferase subunit GatC [Bacteroidota bacterium]
MQVNDTLIDKLANLARLHFNENEQQAIKTDLQKMIGFINKLKEVNTENVKPLLHVTTNVNIMRADKVEQVISHQDALKNAPVTDGEFFKVPKVIKK